MRRTQVAVLVGSLAFATPAWAQQKYADPNMGHFYMARQQIQILDDAPQVTDMRTNPVPPGKQAPPNIARPMPLPRAGWVPYSQTIPSVQNSLPQTFNGVPKAPPPQANIDPKRAKAGVYKGGKNSGAQAAMHAPSPPHPTVAKTYAPYKGYGGNSPMPVSSASNGGSSTATHVQGNLLNQSGTSMLHWSRTRKPNY